MVANVATEARTQAVWDVVRVSFPYADQPVIRRRPALVIAVPEAPDRFSVLWLLMITSARHERWPGDVALQHWDSAGLFHPCVVRTGKVATIDTRLTEPLGVLAAEDRATVSQALTPLLRAIIAG